MKRLVISLAIFVGTLLVQAPDALAAKQGDSQNCRPCCQKCCKVVCEMKEVKKTVWNVACEEFCVANPARGCCNVRCGKVRCRKQLVKKEITVKVPVYRCVVVDCTCGK